MSNWREDTPYDREELPDHALQGEINYIVEILEDHTFGDNIFIPQLKGEGFHKQIIEGGNMMTYLDHNTNKFICEDSLEELLYRLPKEVIKQLHEITLREYEKEA